jgi:alpha-L-rhamnosidase
VKAFYNCPYGLIRCEWKKYDSNLELNIEIPVNASAVINLPDNVTAITESGQKLDKTKGIIKYGIENDQYKVNVGSGKYEFKMEIK